MTLRILFIQQEWPTEFRRSTQWSYISSLGYVEALRACGAEVFLLTSPLLPFAAELLHKGDFDQVWLNDLVHLDVPPSLLAWAEDLAPMRVGLVGESLTHTEDELADLPDLATRDARVQARAVHTTHLLMCDEADARRYAASGHRALWLPPGMLRSMVAEVAELGAACDATRGDTSGRGGRHFAARSDAPIGFIGDLYAKRIRFFADHGIAERVVGVRPNDRPPEIEAAYLALARRSADVARVAPEARIEHVAAYARDLITLRRHIFERYLHAFSGLLATLNPPSIVKGYPGRVVEAIGRGVVVVSARPKDRPGAERMFEPGREILLFDAADAPGLCRELDALRADVGRAREIATRARARLLADHTLEARCARALRFVSETSGVGLRGHVRRDVA